MDFASLARSLAGFALVTAIAVSFSSDHRSIDWRLVLLKTGPGRDFFGAISNGSD